MKFLEEMFEFPMPGAIIGWGFILWGIYTFLSSITAFFMMPIILQYMQGLMHQIRDAMNSSYYNFFMDHWVISLSMMLVLSLLKILGGINLLRRKLWAKYLIQGICGLVVFLQVLGLFFYSHIDYSKLMMNMNPGNMPPQASQTALMGATIGMAVGVVFSLGFISIMTFIIIYLNTKKIRQSFGK